MNLPFFRFTFFLLVYLALPLQLHKSYPFPNLFRPRRKSVFFLSWIRFMSNGLMLGGYRFWHRQKLTRML